MRFFWRFVHDEKRVYCTVADGVVVIVIASVGYLARYGRGGAAVAGALLLTLQNGSNQPADSVWLIDDHECINDIQDE